MKRKQASKKKDPADAFGPFKKGTRSAFSFLLEAPYNFKEVETIVYGYECTIRFENSTTGVLVQHEWESTPWVTLKKRDLTRNGPWWYDESFGLRFIVMERCPTALDRVFPKHFDKLEDVLDDLAQLLKECGHDLLLGDFQIAPRLRELAEAAERQSNLELFGSEDGTTG